MLIIEIAVFDFGFPVVPRRNGRKAPVVENGGGLPHGFRRLASLSYPQPSWLSSGLQRCQLARLARMHWQTSRFDRH